MLKKERAAYIMKKLDEVFPEAPIPLVHSNKFELLIAVLLSAQCTDERVNKVSPKLFSLANNPKEMSK
ncbi:MAG: endonuclease III, partial [Dehalococcoidia bacterium]|nr:endonuclease III [Dehalococcoidia bacterium]